MKNITLKMKAYFIFILMLLVSLTGCASKQARSSQAVPPPTLDIAQNNFRAGEYSKALSQLTFLAINDDREAQYALGYMYYYGLGTTENIDIARGWFRESAAAGFKQAEQALKQIDPPVSNAFPDFSPDL